MGKTIAVSRHRVVDLVGVLSVVLGLLLGLVPGIAPTIANAEHATIGFTDFEIDGGIDGVRDWDHFVGSETSPPDGIGNQDVTWFKASMKEPDYYNAPTAQNPSGGWEFQEGGNAPKADLIRTWLQTQVAAGDGNTWVALATTRDADNGNAQITVEFNQSELTDYSGQFRNDGDFYIRFNFPGSIDNSDPVTVVSAINARYAVWSGDATTGAFGAEFELNSNSDPAVRAAISSLDPTDPDALTFVELIINLEAILGDFGGDGCAAFGAAGFRTEATGGNQNNDNTTLKDVVQPFPIDLNTCAPVTVEKFDAEGNPLAGAEFKIYTDEARTALVPELEGFTTNTCTTDGTGTCSFGQLEPGTYYIDETVVPAGYLKDPVLDVLDDYPNGYRFTVLEQEPVTLTFTDPRIDYSIDVAPDGNNAVGNDHEFTVTLTNDTDDAPMAGETVDLAWTGVGDGITRIQDGDGDTGTIAGVSSTTCVTDGAGSCVVTVSSDDPGSGVLTATWGTPYQNAVASEPVSETAGEPVDEISDTGNKTWIGYRAEIRETATNLLGDPHTFTATVYEVDGSGETLADDVTVTFSWDAGTADGSDFSGGNTCVTGSSATGECEITVVDGGDTGTGTISIVQLDGVVGDDEALSVEFVAGDVSADKTWIAYRATIDDDSVNPADSEHVFTVQVQVDPGTGVWQDVTDGFTVEWTSTGDGSDDLAASTCDDGTDADGQCTIVVTSATAGARTVTLDSVSGDLLGTGETLSFDIIVEEGQEDLHEATKTWLEFEVGVEPDGDNVVGEPHTFWISVAQDDGTGFAPVPAGTVVEYTVEDLDGVLTNDPGTSCVTGDDTRTDGVTETNYCSVTVESDTPGLVTITVTGIDEYQGFDTPSDITFDGSAQATKTWYDYRAFVAADGVNLVGDEHVFTITAQVNDGSGWSAVLDGTDVQFTWTGDGQVTETNGVSDIDATSCTTTGGTCTVTVDSATPGSGTIEVQAVENTSATDSDLDFVDVSAGANLGEGQSASADKTWIDYRASIEASATNLTGDAHVFTITAEQNDGSGWVPVPDGTDIGYSTDNDGVVTGDTCTNIASGDGTCTVTVNSSEVDEVTVTVDTVSAEDVDGNPIADVSGSDASASKTWISVRVAAEADALNLIGEEHVFTVSIDVLSPTFPGGLMAPNGTTAVVSASGTGSIVDTTCDTGTVDGECTVTVNSNDPGSLTISVDQVSFTYDSTDFVVDLDGTSGVADGQDRTATKTWRAYRAFLEADGLNLVRDAHTFNVTVEQTDDGSSWAPVPDGTTLLGGLGGDFGDEVIDFGASTCFNPTGTTDGDCVVVVSSDLAGSTYVSVTGIANTTIGDDRTYDFEEDETSIEFVNPIGERDATKTWAAFRATIGPDAVNLTGDPHDFPTTVEYTVDGSTWLAVPDGSELSFTSSGVGTTVTDSPCITSGGACTITVDSDDAGQRTVTLTGIDAEITNAGITESFSVTFEDGASGVLDGFDADDYEATKTWASYTLTLSPLEAVNLLDGSDTDPERYHDVVIFLDSDNAEVAPTDGQTVDVTLTGDAVFQKREGEVNDAFTILTDTTATCVTDGSGFCTVTIFSASPGSATVDASYDGTVGETEFTIEAEAPANKDWTTFRVTVTPETDENLVDNAHTFTVTIEQSVPAATCESPVDGWCPVEGGVPTIDIAASNPGALYGIDTSDCDNGTAADGTCVMTLNSSEAQAITVTATYEESYEGYSSEGEGSASFSDDGEKEYVDYAISIDPLEADNLVDTDHTFTVRVTKSTSQSGGSFVGLPNVTPTITVTGVGGDTLEGTCDEGTDADGFCTVIITSGEPGLTTVEASYTGANASGTETREESVSAVKNWIDYRLTIDPDAINLVGDEHTFIATLEVATELGEGGQPDWQPASNETLDVVITGVGDDTGVSTCVTGDSGTCAIVINSGDPGTTTVSVSYDAVVGETSRTDEVEAVKTWVAFRGLIETDGTNYVLEDHEFTATAEYSVGDGWLAVPDGSTLSYDSAGVGTTSPDGSCTIAAGACAVTVSSPITGTRTVTLTGVDATIPYGEGGASFSVTFDEGAVGVDAAFDAADYDATKTWVNYALVIDDDAINAVGDAHVFTATLFFDAGDGQGFQPLAGEAVDVTVDPADDYVSDTCSQTDENGQCTITVNSDEVGSTTVTVSFTEAVDGVERTFDDEAVKTWTDITLVKAPVLAADSASGDSDLIDSGFGAPLLQFSVLDPSDRTAEYSYVITNTSDVTLTNIVLTDDRIGDIPVNVATLAPGESTTVFATETFSIDQAPEPGALATTVTNTAVVTANPVDDPEVIVTDDDPADIRIEVVDNVIVDATLQKLVVFNEDISRDLNREDPRFASDDPAGFFGIGSWSTEETAADAPKTLEFAYVITNTGNVPLTDLRLVDVADHNTSLLADQDPQALIETVILDGTEGVSLAPGESITLVEELTVRPSDFFNAAEFDIVEANAGSGTGFSKDHTNTVTLTANTEDGENPLTRTEDATIGLDSVLSAGPGLGDAGGLLPLSVLLTMIGAAVLWLNRRLDMVA